MAFRRLRGKLEGITNPIPRDRDNTDDLDRALMEAHTRYTKIPAPAGKDGLMVDPSVVGQERVFPA